jgi:hypothetical protein
MCKNWSLGDHIYSNLQKNGEKQKTNMPGWVLPIMIFVMGIRAFFMAIPVLPKSNLNTQISISPYQIS